MAKRPKTRSEADETATKPARQKEPRSRAGRSAAAAQPGPTEPIGEIKEPPSNDEPTPAQDPDEDFEPSEEEIRLRAYHRYLDRGGEHGAHFDDWLEAERELKNKSKK